MPKKLIEVSIPLKEINAASAREKSIRHGHPSTLHLWWSRKPLATTRAVLWASLVDDPGDDEKRKDLFAILRKLVIWENTNNPDVLREARACLPKDLPELLDPFAGGGSIPLEGQRLGLTVHAHDLNPVAVLINKAMIEIPPKFAELPPVNPETRRNIGSDTGWAGASGLAEDVRYYGERMKEMAFARIGNMYPTIRTAEGEAKVIAWIWARTVKCPNPACGCEMPLVNSFVLSSKKGREVYVEPVIVDGKISGYEVRQGKNAPESPKTGKGSFKCAVCGAAVSNEYLHEQFKAGHDGRVMIGIAAEGRNGRIYVAPNEEHIKAADVPLPEDYPEVEMNQDCTDLVSGRGYGFTHWHQLFTNRQLTMLTTFSDLVSEVQEIAENDAKGTGRDAKEYAEAVGVYLAFVVDKLTQYNSTLCLWDATRDGIAQAFGRQALPMVWNFAESNPFCNSSGCFSNMLDWVTKAVGRLPAKAEGEASRAEAQDEEKLRNVMISTDPPYYDNIGYADLSDYFYIWMRRSLRNIYPELFRTMLVPSKDNELIATPYRHDNSPEKAKTFFESGMAEVCKNLYKYATEDYPITIYYAYKQNENDSASSGWETMLKAVIKAGFTITGTWPVHTELTSALKTNINALGSSVVLVCRKRSPSAPHISRRNFLLELKRELSSAIQTLSDGSISPVDLPQSAIGPGMMVYSKYSGVLEPDGTPITVRDALREINALIDGDDEDLDSESRFCVELYRENGFDVVSYDDALKIARAKNVSVESMNGTVFAEKGQVHLIDREDLKADAVGVWALAQRLTYAMEKGGNPACGAIVKACGKVQAEKARRLAYRLYSIAERRKWAEEARKYNDLAESWNDVLKWADTLAKPVAEQINIPMED